MSNRCCWWPIALGLSAAVAAVHAQEAPEPSYELLFFLSADYVQRNELQTSTLAESDFTPVADFFYSRTANRFKILTEALLTDEEEELERLQFGWQIAETTRVWFGRFHEAGSWWNTEYHHGQFLQTSISRPAIENFEDLGGVLPSHTTGVLFERQQPMGRAALDLSVSAGLTGTLEDGRIESLDLLDPDRHHGRGASLRLAWLPEPLSENQIALTWRDYELNVMPGVALPPSWLAAERIDVETYGVLADWSFGQWRLNAVGNTVKSLPRGVIAGRRTEFSSSYAQIERRVDDWIVYARAEHTSGEEDYLDFFPAHARRQSVFGAKWALAKQHALTFEAGTSEVHSDHFHGLAIQWSAVLP